MFTRTNLSISEVYEMLFANFTWRKEFNMKALMKETFGDDILGVLGYIVRLLDTKERTDPSGMFIVNGLERPF